MTHLHKSLHIQYVKDLDSRLRKQTLEYWLSEHLRLNGIYWGAMALATMNALETLPKEEVVAFVLSCFDTRKGGFAAFPGHDAHVLTTLSGLQVLLLYESLDALDETKKKAIVDFILSLRLPDGSFTGDEFGEIDTRFVFVSLYSLKILGALTPEITSSAAEFIMACENFDGGFGMFPGAESHAAQVYTCVAALALCDLLDLVKERTAAWLSERQVIGSGGFNGRPEKLPDVCYSWWVLLSLAALGKTNYVDFDALESFILECQDQEAGGFSDRANNQTDVYHTCFALQGLSLMFAEKYGLQSVDPVLCLPTNVAAKIQSSQ